MRELAILMNGPMVPPVSFHRNKEVPYGRS